MNSYIYMHFQWDGPTFFAPISALCMGIGPSDKANNVRHGHVTY